MKNEKPMIGAAMKAERLVEYQAWLIEGQRDLEIQNPTNAEFLDKGWQAQAAEIRDILDGYTGRLGIHGPYDGLVLNARDRRVQALVAERYRQALDFGAAIGASHMVIHSPFIFLGDSFGPHAPSSPRSEEQIGYAHQTLESVLPLAVEMDCTLVIETILDRNTGPLLQLVRSFESDYVRLSLDTGHAFCAHCNGGPSPDQWVRDAGAWLGHLHLQDTDGLYDRHWLPGQGRINWFALFEALATLDHQPRLVLEVNSQAKLLDGARWLAEQGFVL